MTREAAYQPPMELWGGMECTINRVGDTYHDQLQFSGHYERLADLDRFAGLGIRALRFPVLWERVPPHGLAHADWRWVDERLNRLREVGVEPIVGLVHHGSGPRPTDLTRADFAPGLAVFAQAVTRRYPWVRQYTPVNEPLTTARFSGLYGHSHPHQRDEPSFAAALLNQCRSVALSMAAIRDVQPEARLVQTEDIGKVYSTPALAYQADFENERRWASFDLLTGRLTPDCRMWRHFRAYGAPEQDLAWHVAHPCPPDIFGVNHYLSGERFLDERLERYPEETHGGNGRQAYADVLALRVLEEGVAGPGGILLEAWRRYGAPLAFTEAHNGCTREEQLRWLWDVWQGALAARASGAVVRAVTVWSLLGAYDWDRLVTRFDGHYEPGVYDLRSASPRPTPLATLMRDLAAGQRPSHPALVGPGWWRRPERLHYPSVRLQSPEKGMAERPDDRERAPGASAARSTAARLGGSSSCVATSRPLLIIGDGALATAVADACYGRGLEHRSLGAATLDAAEPAAVGRALARLRPWAVVNATVGAAQYGAPGFEASAASYRCCTLVPALLSAMAARYAYQFVTFSSDLVFDDRMDGPHDEQDTPTPAGVIGRALADGERRALAARDDTLVIRSGPLFGSLTVTGARPGIPVATGAARHNEAADEAVVSPTYVPDVVTASLDLLMDGEAGVWHLANAGAMPWATFRRAVEVGANAPEEPVAGSEPAPIPNRSLTSTRGALMPSIEDAVGRHLANLRATRQTSGEARLGASAMNAPLVAPVPARP